jgi:hypothetical protein
MPFMTASFAQTSARAAALVALALAGSASLAGPVYRCPGEPVNYTDQITPQQAKDRGCKALDGAPITIAQPASSRARPAAAVEAASSSTASPGTASQRPNEQRVDPKEQRERDADARRILETELRREEDKLASLRKDYNQGEPERQGNEKNYQRYLDRVEEMKQGIARKEADIAAIKRELAKFGGSNANNTSASSRSD